MRRDIKELGAPVSIEPFTLAMKHCETFHTHKEPAKFFFIFCLDSGSESGMTNDCPIGRPMQDRRIATLLYCYMATVLHTLSFILSLIRERSVRAIPH